MIRLRNTATAFGWPTRILHWLMAIGLLGALAFGTYLARIEPGLDTLWMYGAHKTVGLTLLALALLRILWHRVSPPPRPLPDTPFRTAAARSTHAAFYVLMLAVPLSGWIASSATGIDTVIFGRWTVPAIAPVSETWEAVFFGVHGAATKLLAALILVHVAGALVRRDGTLRRMVRGATA